MERQFDCEMDITPATAYKGVVVTLFLAEGRDL